jgi:hypothetical protein
MGVGALLALMRRRTVDLLVLLFGLLVPACGRFGATVPKPVLDRYLAVRYVSPRIAQPKITVLSMADAEAENKRKAPTEGLHPVQPVTDADRQNGVTDRYVVTISGVLQTVPAAQQEEIETVFTKLGSGVWLTDLAAFNADGSFSLLKNMSGAYVTATDGPFSGNGVRCEMQLGAAPPYAGTYACHGARSLDGRVNAFAWFDLPEAMRAQFQFYNVGIALLSTPDGGERRCVLLNVGGTKKVSLDCRMIGSGAPEFPIGLMTFRQR